MRSTRGRTCYDTFYDIRQAYDTVGHVDVVRSLQRLLLPPLFVQLVRDTLIGLTSAVRSAYGMTAVFMVRRSLR